MWSGVILFPQGKGAMVPEKDSKTYNRLYRNSLTDPSSSVRQEAYDYFKVWAVHEIVPWAPITKRQSDRYGVGIAGIPGNPWGY